MTESTRQIIKLTDDVLRTWANDTTGPVALNLRQKLLSVESETEDETIIYPPTYAGDGYNIDTLGDGTKVALIDSVGSQANRLEPVFIADDPLVPQISINLDGNAKPHSSTSISLLELAHRAADAVVQSSPELLPQIEDAFNTLHETGNAFPLCCIAPTSLVFGVWDSRGGSGEKRPRLVRSVIRAWDVDKLETHSQFNSIWKRLSDRARDELTDESKKKKKKLSEAGLNDAPAKGLGGILVRGRIERCVTVNLIALRGLRGGNETESKALREYLLGLALTAATTDIDLYLREGCHLRYAEEDRWLAVPRRGSASPEIDLSSASARGIIKNFTQAATDAFRPKWPTELEYKFDLKAAKKLLSKKSEEDS